MDFNEYTPKCGWLAYNRRRRFAKKVKTAALGITFAALYFMAAGFCGYIELH
ncbi:hypothetical protein [Fibrobacter sp. UWH4]|uniref:hypothetical protein n=1 Tax=Fibrobacter sp. UWH4 TaxID=1896210 RepID=UPI00091E266E|nr:hypothetical protein [Fibrobacter sp. UWH4]SHL06538.1 hypothetical protein SAMN05720762_10495 [Fibrobacter sp. UWH4]